MKKMLFLNCLLLLFVVGCKNNTTTEKHQRHRNKIINIQDKIVDIKSEIIFGNSLLYIIDNILIINEVMPKGVKGIHLFDKNTFKYITSTGIIGRGPGEISVPGGIGIDKKNRVLWVPDYGKKVIYKFPLDSILKNKMFKPSLKLALNDDLFMTKFCLLNDSIVLGKAVQVLTNSSFLMAMSKLNLNSNKTEKFGYDNPKASGRKSSSQFALSLENNLYVNSYYYCDLITICDLEGNLKYNIYGPDWSVNKDFTKSFFFGVDVFDKKIIASYIGDIDENEYKGNVPSKFLVFDIEGNYMGTIETGYKFTYFCVDEEKKRVISYFVSRVDPLGYFELDLATLKE